MPICASCLTPPFLSWGLGGVQFAKRGNLGYKMGCAAEGIVRRCRQCATNKRRSEHHDVRLWSYPWRIKAGFRYWRTPLGKCTTTSSRLDNRSEWTEAGIPVVGLNGLSRVHYANKVNHITLNVRTTTIFHFQPLSNTSDGVLRTLHPQRSYAEGYPHQPPFSPSFSTRSQKTPPECPWRWRESGQGSGLFPK